MSLQQARFCCRLLGKTQVQSILKRKAELLEELDSDGSGSQKQALYRTDYDDIDQLTWTWFQRARGLNTPVSGPIIQQRARDQNICYE